MTPLQLVLRSVDHLVDMGCLYMAIWCVYKRTMSGGPRIVVQKADRE